MRRVTFALTAALMSGAVVAAQDPKPAQPPAAQPKALQPALPLQPRVTIVTAARMLQLEEDVETLEAHREVKKAYIKAAEIGVRAAEVNLDRLVKLLASAVITKEEVERAKLEVEMAKAQVDIRTAELKEVEVKVKFAKKRLEDAKAAGVRPAPGAAPKATDPPPAAGSALVDDAKLARWKATLEKARVDTERKAAQAEADAKAIVAELEERRRLSEKKFAEIKEKIKQGKK